MRTILPGRPQSSRQALCTINWDGLRLVAYISGSNIIVFNGRREILQSIAVDETDRLHSLCIEEESGHIAVSDESNVYTYRPVGRDYGDLRWVRSSTLNLKAEESAAYLSWGLTDELLLGGNNLSIWNLVNETRPEKIWTSSLSVPLSVALFSPDGNLIASFAQHDRIVKIWRRLSYESDNTRFDVSYLPHPSTVTDISWRKRWHREQNLDNVLYTFCADNQVRVWAHSDHYTSSALQKIITIDASASIQPRRLSTGSMSKTRFASIVGSSDVAHAAERALQTYRQGTDHALEHLVEVANRSPEICLVMDGRGHMSAWGIENAGLRNKLAPEKFNIALVDGVDINLPSQESASDFAHIYAFANNDMSASLCILVHSYSGQIDWYQGSFIRFFDTAARSHRVELLSCWSGHDTALDRMFSSIDSHSFLSLTDNNQLILWSQSQSGALVRTSELTADDTVVDAALIDTNFAFLLHADALTIWDLRGKEAKILVSNRLLRPSPKAVSVRSSQHSAPKKVTVMVHYEDNMMEHYSVRLPTPQNSSRSNGYHELITLVGMSTLPNMSKRELSAFSISSPTTTESRDVFAWSQEGLVRMFSTKMLRNPSNRESNLQLSTHINTSTIATLIGGFALALVHADYRTISIWNVVESSYDFIQTFDQFGEIQDLHWHMNQENLCLLALQFPYHIVIIGPQRYEDNPESSAWRVLQTVPTRPHSRNMIESFCWLEPLELVLGLGSQIFTFDLKIQPRGSDKSPSLATEREGNVGHLSLRLETCALPNFAPDVLFRQLQIGNYTAVLQTLENLHNDLKFLTDGEIVPTNASANLASIAATAQHFKVGVNVTSIVLPGDIDFDLNDVQQQLKDNLSKISPEQLSVAQKLQLTHTITNTTRVLEHQKSLDSCALVYLSHFFDTMNGSPGGMSEMRSIPYAALCHAYLSQTQEALLHFILGFLDEHNIKLTWSMARSLGLFLFITDRDLLKIQLESVARVEYNRNQDDRNPVDCSLYYLALEKKSILQSLWRRAIGFKEKEATIKLLAQNFKEQRWKATALKNAYALLSKRRFEYGAAFFLLGGSLTHAVNVCINQLHDVQLAIALARVWEGDSAQRDRVMSSLIEKDILDSAVDSYDARWMAIWGCIHTQNWQKALSYIMGSIDTQFEEQFKTRKRSESDEQQKENVPFKAMNYRSNDPTLLINMYIKLRSTLIQSDSWTRDMVTPSDEWQFVMRCADWYLRAGMHWLALDLVVNWQFVQWKQDRTLKPTEEKAFVSKSQESAQKSALDEWLEPDTSAAETAVQPVKSHKEVEKPKARPPPTQFIEPSADSLLDSFGF